MMQGTGLADPDNSTITSAEGTQQTFCNHRGDLSATILLGLGHPDPRMIGLIWFHASLMEREYDNH